jgi:hypothetical protein
MSQVTLAESQAFMKKRCADLKMEYIDGRSMKWDESTTIYIFLTKQNQNYCVSSISQYSLEVLSAKCGGIEKKTEYLELFK